MKKHLLSTSAIALGVAMASPAAAQQWDPGLGGYFNTHVGISDIDNDVNPTADQDGVNVFTNAEIYFSPSITLDNGMTFGATVQLEALNSGNSQIDESFMTISSDMLGKIVLGSENSAGYGSMIAAPQVGSMAINSASVSAFVPFTGTGGFRQAMVSSYTEVAGNNDVQRISYYTPSFNGLTIGVSYAPSSAGNASNNAPVDFDAVGDTTDIFDIGLSYSQSFNGVDVNFGARYGTGETNVSPTVTIDPETWAVGGQVGASGFTFGVGYSENESDLPGGVNDQQGLSIGAAYDLAGPWEIGLEGYFGERDTATNDAELNIAKLVGSRSLGSGVSWDVYYAYVQSENAAGVEIEGNVIATAVNLSF